MNMLRGNNAIARAHAAETNTTVLTVDDAVAALRRLRRVGIRSHFWV